MMTRTSTDEDDEDSDDEDSDDDDDFEATRSLPGSRPAGGTAGARPRVRRDHRCTGAD